MKFFDIHTHQLKKNSIYNWLPEEPFPDQLCSIGLHPWYLEKVSWNIIEEYSQREQVIFIGETGLDYACDVDREKQKKFFTRHIQLAAKLNKPLILHCVKAYSDCLSELKSFSGSVIFHDYNGGPEETASLLKRPKTFFSLGTTLFRDNSKVVANLQQIPLTQLFFETDDSERSIEVVYQRYSDLSVSNLSDVSQQVSKNLNNLKIV